MKHSLGAKPLAFTTPVWVIGTYDADGKANIMTASWAGICCSKPPCVGVSLRKATHTYGALVRRKAFTVNIPSAERAAAADYVGMASGRNVDKFAAVGLTPERSTLVDAPFVKEFSLVLECRVIQSVEIGLHTQFIGEILDVKADSSVLGENGLPDVGKVQPIVYGPEIGTYHALGAFLGRAFELGRSFEASQK